MVDTCSSPGLHRFPVLDLALTKMRTKSWSVTSGERKPQLSQEELHLYVCISDYLQATKVSPDSSHHPLLDSHRIFNKRHISTLITESQRIHFSKILIRDLWMHQYGNFMLKNIHMWHLTTKTSLTVCCKAVYSAMLTIINYQLLFLPPPWIPVPQPAQPPPPYK